MNKLDEMYRICQYCPAWEICDPPYVCALTEQKLEKMRKEAADEKSKELGRQADDRKAENYS